LNNWLSPRGNTLGFASIIQIPSASMTSEDEIGSQLGLKKIYRKDHGGKRGHFDYKPASIF
jgi:hypothetical protein